MQDGMEITRCTGEHGPVFVAEIARNLRLGSWDSDDEW